MLAQPNRRLRAHKEAVARAVTLPEFWYVTGRGNAMQLERLNVN